MNEVRLRNYLLGRLPEADAERLENEMLEDDALFRAMQSAEDDLFDDFARGRLDAGERAAFEQRLAVQRGRVKFAGALKQRVNVVAFPRSRWIGLAAAAAVAIAVLGIFYPRSETPAPAASRPATRVVVPVAKSIAVTLTLGATRSENAATPVAVPRDVSSVELHVRLDPNDRFDRYSMELRSGRPVWRVDGLHAASEGDQLLLSAAVPADHLTNGTYELLVRGGDEDIGFVTLEIQRTK